jgi:hypothetical protein
MLTHAGGGDERVGVPESRPSDNSASCRAGDDHNSCAAASGAYVSVSPGACAVGGVVG